MRQTVSFTRKADRTPAVNTSAQRSVLGPDTERSTRKLAHRKNPASPRYEARIIVPRRSPRVSPFTAALACTGEITPAATMRTPPRSAAAGPVDRQGRQSPRRHREIGEGEDRDREDHGPF
jgi:hypothetical protein